MRLTIVGPNLPNEAGATFHVHAAGCADVTRSPLYRHADPPMDLDADTAVEVCDFVYEPEDFDCESGEWLSEFRFMPCCANLPTR